MFLLCSFLGIACIYDYGYRRIPNALVGIMLIGGIIEGIIGRGLYGGGAFLLKVFCVVLVLYPLFKIGAFGAGDVKLYGVCAGFYPSKKIFWFLFISLLVAAIFSLIKFIKERNVRKVRKSDICLAGPILCSTLLYLGGIY